MSKTHINTYCYVVHRITSKTIWLKVINKTRMKIIKRTDVGKETTESNTNFFIKINIKIRRNYILRYGSIIFEQLFMSIITYFINVLNYIFQILHFRIIGLYLTFGIIKTYVVIISLGVLVLSDQRYQTREGRTRLTKVFTVITIPTLWHRQVHRVKRDVTELKR